VLIIAGTLTIDPSKVDQALADAVEMMRASQAEDGCHAYVFSADPLVPGQLQLFEKWESPEALAAHSASDHMKAFQSKMPGWGVTGADIKKYEIASEGPLR
jgi:quinol monooxygenase YgiN